MSQIDPFDTPKLPDLAEQGFPVAPSPRVLGHKGQNGQHSSVSLSKYFYCPVNEFPVNIKLAQQFTHLNLLTF